MAHQPLFEVRCRTVDSLGGIGLNYHRQELRRSHGEIENLEIKMLLTPAEAVRRIGISTGENVTHDQWLHWIGSGHVRVDCYYKGRTPLVRDDEVERVGHLWARGGKGYLPLYRGGQTLLPSSLVGDLLAVTRREVIKLCHQGKLEGQRIGYRLFVDQQSLRMLVASQPWRLNQSLIVSEPIVQEFYGGSEMLGTGP